MVYHILELYSVSSKCGSDQVGSSFNLQTSLFKSLLKSKKVIESQKMSECYNLKSRSAKNLRAESFHHIDFFCEDRHFQPSHMALYGAHVIASARKEKNGWAGQRNDSYDYETSKTWSLKVC